MPSVVYVFMFFMLATLASSAPTSLHRQPKTFPYFEYMDPEAYSYIDDDYLSMLALERNDISRTIPKRRHPSVQPPMYNSPIYYIRLPPQPYMFVPGLGYISQPPPPQPSQFLNLPLNFVANGKPSGIYQWAGNVDFTPTPTSPPRKPPPPSKKPDSTIHRLPGQFAFNGKPDDIFVLRDSYNSLYGDALQNFYP